MDADLGLLKHSNVARLYRVHHATDPANGIFRFYIPGIGTYFKKVRDNGGSKRGNAFGAIGQARLEFALREFDEAIARPCALNIVEEINVAVFGFSRGAALARAFISMMMETRCVLQKSCWKLRKAPVPVNFKFMGLFDTVASVGKPMSANNTDYWNPAMGDVAAMILERLEDYPETKPQALAFGDAGTAGADPAPGDNAGHDAWGARMAIHESVMEVRHFIAAHEIRNSFPVDSISRLSNGVIVKPPHFFETVYPGSHSDVGGGYAPGEGAKGILPSENLCLIPLRHMYDYALRQGVPFLPITAQRNVQDFEVAEHLRKTYDHYLKIVGGGAGIGQLMNKNREIYLAWRFSSIKRKRNTALGESTQITEYKEKYQAREKLLAAEVAALAKIESAARLDYDLLLRKQKTGGGSALMARGQGVDLISETRRIEAAREKYAEARDNRLQAEARRNAVPNMESYYANLSLYDQQLHADVKSILSELSGNSDSIVQRKNLRPHYKVLLKAYEDEFHDNRGLRDPDVIAFFDLYVHDSLAGFAKDATLPSDPRVVYVGGDQKLQFAKMETPHDHTTLLA